VLKGADFLFVADSEVGKMEENKDSSGTFAPTSPVQAEPRRHPWVIQYNKRDLPNVYTLDELNQS
jgi:hypothetical protein